MENVLESLYIYHFTTVIDFSSEKYSGSTGYKQELLVPAEKFTVRIHQLDKLNSFTAIAFELVSSMARALGL